MSNNRGRKKAEGKIPGQKEMLAVKSIDWRGSSQTRRGVAI